MQLDSIQALLEALKQAEGKGGIPGDDDDLGKPVAAKLSIMRAVPLDKHALPDTADLSDDALGGSSNSDSSLPDDMNDLASDHDSDQGDAKVNQQNAQIVDTLQDQYPQIYDRIMKQIDAGQSDADSQNYEDGGAVTDDDDPAELAAQEAQLDDDERRMSNAFARGRTSGSLGGAPSRYFTNLR